MKVNEFIKEVKMSYSEQFPLSACAVEYSDNLYRSIGINCKLAGKKEENSGGYWENDMFHIRFSISAPDAQLPKGTTEETDLPEVIQLEVWDKSYLTKPENKYMAYGRRRLKFRKTTGTPESIVKTLDKYFKAIRTQLEEDVKNENITADHIELLKAKLI